MYKPRIEDFGLAIFLRLSGSEDSYKESEALEWGTVGVVVGNDLYRMLDDPCKRKDRLRLIIS